jgi:hypothetical protein
LTLNAVTSSVTSAPTKPIIAPYITAWSAEVDPPATVVGIPGGGIGYADEKATDRDKHGVLWARASRHPGEGRPVFKKVHPIRQRRAMRNLLCQVCGGPADRNDDGVLWLLRDFRDDWQGWPNQMSVTEPPVCQPCVHLSMKLCPALRRGAAVIRARQHPIVAVRGSLHVGQQFPRPVKDMTVHLDNPTVRWVKAVNLVRELQDCTLFEVSDVQAGLAGA